MCRLFGLLGSGSNPQEWLVRSDRSLLAQSHVSEEHAQRDGWGIAWRRPGEPLHLERGIGGAYAPEERERYLAAAAAARGTLVVAHLRHASNPMNLPRSRLIGVENSQPFAHGPLLFAHNGKIALPRETRPLLGALEAAVNGVNDSEVLFYLLAHHLDAGATPPIAYERSIADLRRVWEEQGRPSPEPYTGLNVLLSPGPEELWAFCHWIGEHGPSFFDPERPYYRMAYRVDAQLLLVGSEPFDRRPGWRSLDNGEFLRARLSHGLVAIDGGHIGLESPSTETAPP